MGCYQVVGGDFFEAVPAEGDAYILRQILHDWYNADAVRILEQCRAAMKPSGRVLVVERAMYANAGGVTWSAGTAAVATRLQ